MNAAPSNTPPEEGYPRFRECIPVPVTADGDYRLHYATTLEELAAVQRLRYEVFNLELNEGLSESHATGLDQDAFDESCHHLYIRNETTGAIVGTYRMQTWEMAKSALGFYSATEFDFSDVPDTILRESVEIGRACIDKSHRSLKVLYLLWKGLGNYVAFNRKRYLFGCCSLTSQNAAEGTSVYRFLEREGHLHPDLNVKALPSHHCLEDAPSAGDERPPRLMRAYLSLGAKICSEPAIDRQFQTIDYLALFDVEMLQKSDLAFYRIRE